MAVSRDDVHRSSEVVRPVIGLLEGLGVDGDARAGATVPHCSRVAVDPTRPNLRQVHLVDAAPSTGSPAAVSRSGPASWARTS